tara:strand:+ start:1182 stop:1400 length:219 start_codon:yes stop_codon:yes gene_type:complete
MALNTNEIAFIQDTLNRHVRDSEDLLAATKFLERERKALKAATTPTPVVEEAPTTKPKTTTKPKRKVLKAKN